MKNYIDLLLEKLDDLCKFYEVYTWKYEDSKFAIVVQDNSILFYLYSLDGDIDKFTIVFNDFEYELYEYIALNVLNIVLGTVYIHVNGNEFYNNVHKSSFKLFINDDKILALAKELVSKQDEQYIHQGIEKIKYRFYFDLDNPTFWNSLDIKLEFVRRLL